MTDQLLACYLAVGADELRRERMVRAIKDRLEEGLAAFNLDERTASSDLDPTELAISLNTMPVGDSFRLVIVHDAGNLLKAVSEMIVSYLANPNPGCVLFLEAEALAKNTRLYKAVSKVGARAVIDCTPPKRQDLVPYLVKKARSKGLTIDSRVAAEIISRSGESTTMLDNSLNALVDRCGRRRITSADVEATIARTADVTPWEFLDKVVVGDAARALNLYAMMRGQSPFGLLTLLVRKFRQVICARSLIDRGQRRQVASTLKSAEWQVKAVIAGAQKRSPAQLTRCMRALAQAERDLKSGADETTTMVTLVAALCERG